MEILDHSVNQKNHSSDGSHQEREMPSMDRGHGSEKRRESGRSNEGASNRGFAAMSPEKQKEIASEGGRAAHQLGVAHEWNSEEARQAGRKGGQSVSQNREHMSEIGRRGGQSSGGRRAARNKQNENGEK
ncbi:MAG: hypothetical protein NVS1B13_18530 [Flavisolibacter sp.]